MKEVPRLGVRREGVVTEHVVVEKKVAVSATLLSHPVLRGDCLQCAANLEKKTKTIKQNISSKGYILLLGSPPGHSHIFFTPLQSITENVGVAWG